jgi:hypothetical protein
VIGETFDPETATMAKDRWQQLRQLPAGEAESRVVALRRSAQTCSVVDGLMTPSPR